MRYIRINEDKIKALDFASNMEAEAQEAAQALVAAGDWMPEYVRDVRTGARFVIDVLIPEEVESGDGRTFNRGALSVKDGPIELMWQIQTAKGHDGSVIVGRIDHVERIDPPEDNSNDEEPSTEEIADGALSDTEAPTEVKYGWGRAYGVFDTGAFGREAERLVREGFLRGVSADMDNFEANGEELSENDVDDTLIKNEKITISKARVIGATLVAKPAFQECQIRLEEPIFDFAELPVEDGMYEEEYEDVYAMSAALTASAAPLEPPTDWFTNPRLNGPTPLTVSEDGKVFGHIATWSTDHIGLPRGTKPPRSRSNYAYFRTGVIRTSEGKDVPVGQLTLAGGHASLNASAEEAVKHYDDTASAVADVAAGEDAYGIWIAGALRPSVTGEQVRALRASAPSGDWRPISGRLELVAICQVNVPGFPTARAMVSSGHITALVAAGARPLAEMRAKSLEERLEALESREFASEAEKYRARLTEFVHSEQESLMASAKPALEMLEEFERQTLEARVASLREKFNNL